MSNLRSQKKHRVPPYHDYAEVPWHRRSSLNSGLLFVQLFAWSFFPISLWVCLMLLTGDIYYYDKNVEGNLKPWGTANRIAAFVLLVASLAILVFNPFHRAK